MELIKIVKQLALGAFVGCFILCMVIALISTSSSHSVSFDGLYLTKSIFASILIGWAFSISGLIYNNEDLPLVLQVLIQMICGFTALAISAVTLGWIPLDEGLDPFISFLTSAIIFAVIFWLGFYLYYYFQAKQLNEKISIINKEE
ncbi:MAG: hypothetical protein BZ137_01445 [Methanosphaera sp. rholeuAM130]|nr:DUF3021 domain-containing protein [Methanosphaera sp.]RAP54577.1 MAG: hypothetical protein BZ137_01445 [Methanosphaera sp. rholeuAM130]